MYIRNGTSCDRVRHKFRKITCIMFMSGIFRRKKADGGNDCSLGQSGACIA